MRADASVGVQCLDGGGGGGVDLAAGVVVQEVAQIRTDDDRGFRAAPQRVQGAGDGPGVGAPDGQRDQREVLQQGLKEGQMNFQAVLAGVGPVQHGYLRQSGQPLARPVPVDRDRAQWGAPGGGSGQGKSPERHAVGWPDQHDAAQAPARRFQQGVSACRQGAGIDMPGMGCDDGLGHRRGRRAGVSALLQQGSDVAVQGSCVPGIEHAGHRRSALRAGRRGGR